MDGSVYADRYRLAGISRCFVFSEKPGVASSTSSRRGRRRDFITVGINLVFVGSSLFAGAKGARTERETLGKSKRRRSGSMREQARSSRAEKVIEFSRACSRRLVGFAALEGWLRLSPCSGGEQANTARLKEPVVPRRSIRGLETRHGPTTLVPIQSTLTIESTESLYDFVSFRRVAVDSQRSR